jgi:hypothetical protein
MIIVGVPYSLPELTESGGPYGPSRIVGRLTNKEIEAADISYKSHREKSSCDTSKICVSIKDIVHSIKRDYNPNQFTFSARK